MNHQPTTIRSSLAFPSAHARNSASALTGLSPLRRAPAVKSNAAERNAVEHNIELGHLEEQLITNSHTHNSQTHNSQVLSQIKFASPGFINTKSRNSPTHRPIATDKRVPFCHRNKISSQN